MYPPSSNEHMDSSGGYDNRWDSLSADTDSHPEVSSGVVSLKNMEFDESNLDIYLDEIDEYLDTDNVRIHEAIIKGSIDGHNFGSDRVLRSVGNQIDERIVMARLLEKGGDAAELAHTIAELGVCGFHGTAQSALAGVLESRGLLPAAEATKGGGHMVTGEHVYQPETGQTSVSFAALASASRTMKIYAGKPELERFSLAEAVSRRHEEARSIREGVAAANESYKGSLAAKNELNFSNRLEAVANYIEQNPASLIAALEMARFPVVFGVTRSYTEKIDNVTRGTADNILIGASDMGEFRLTTDKVPLSELPLVLVPEGAVNFVRRLFQRYGVENMRVMKLESLYEGDRAPLPPK